MRARLSDATARGECERTAELLAEYRRQIRQHQANNRRWAREARVRRPKLTAEQIATLIVRSLQGAK